MALTNPLDTIDSQIWTLCERKSDFLALFPTNTVHQVRSSTTASYAPDQELEEANPADYPQVRVLMRGATPGTQRDSTNSFLDVTFSIEIRTGQAQQSVMRDACWAVYRAMLEWQTYVKDAVTWNSKACVYDVDAREIQFDQSADRGTKQWVAVWSTVVRLYFATADLIAN